MGLNKQSPLRLGDRHNHINIRLQYRLDDTWPHLEALGWNEVGFNFYHANDIAPAVLEFKRGFTRFEGTVVWRSGHASDDVVRGTLVNELVYKRAKQVVNDTALQTRLIKLMRVSDMVTEKMRILASLGMNVSDAQMADMVAQRRLERPMFHYGVKVESEAWSAVVQKALNLSSVVISLEKWSESFAGKSQG